MRLTKIAKRDLVRSIILDVMKQEIKKVDTIRRNLVASIVVDQRIKGLEPEKLSKEFQNTYLRKMDSISLSTRLTTSPVVLHDGKEPNTNHHGNWYYERINIAKSMVFTANHNVSDSKTTERLRAKYSAKLDVFYDNQRKLQTILFNAVAGLNTAQQVIDYKPTWEQYLPKSKPKNTAMTVSVLDVNAAIECTKKGDCL